MYKNQYDQDVTCWSPQGKNFQISYAMKAVTLGSVCLGVRSESHVVLAGIKKQSEELADYAKKLHKIDDRMGVAVAGLTSDARSLVKYMRTECLNHRYVFGDAIQAGRLVLDVADKHQRCTQSYVRRPYGVGLLVASCDQSGPRLFQTCPSGNYYEYYAHAIGARSQAARTYLEKHYASFPGLSKDELVEHALKALSACMAGDTEITSKNAEVSFIGAEEDYEMLSEQEVQQVLDRIEVVTAAAEGGGAPEAGDAMDEDDAGTA